MQKPLVMISSWPPRKCGIATFAEEAVEYGIKPNLNGRPIHVISYKDGESQNGEHVHPILDPSQEKWWEIVVEKVRELDPYAVHIQHEYGLYNHLNEDGSLDFNNGFLELLRMLNQYPTIVEPHTVHMRPNDYEEKFLKNLLSYSTIVILKAPMLRERLDKWVLNEGETDGNYRSPKNIAVIRHGAPSGYANRYRKEEVLEELELEELTNKKIVGLIGWIQKNKRLDYVLERWPDILEGVDKRGGNSKELILFMGGMLRDPARHQKAYDMYMELLKPLQEKGLAKFYEFTPRDKKYYKVMSLADLVVLPYIDETQSGTLARTIAVNKPYVTFPIEGLSLQTNESQGGLLAVDEESLVDRIVDLVTDEKRREILSKNLAKYLETRVSWDIVGKLYTEAYKTAIDAMNYSRKPFIVDGPLYNGHF